MTDRELMQQALKALEYGLAVERADAMKALRERLAEPEQEPVAWTMTKTLNKRETTTTGYLWFNDPINSNWTALYTAPTA